MELIPSAQGAAGAPGKVKKKEKRSSKQQASSHKPDTIKR
jgi:hypothetical protein